MPVLIDLEEYKLKLLEIYFMGFNDCFENDDKSSDYEELEKAAYNLGWSHSIIGDDVRSVDYLTEEEILKRIAKSWSDGMKK